MSDKVWWVDTASENSDWKSEFNAIETWQAVAKSVLSDRGLSSWPVDWRLIDDDLGIVYDAEQINEAV